MSRAKLQALGMRIERAAVRPEEIKNRFVRLARPLLKRWATEPALSIEATCTLVQAPNEDTLKEAIRELSKNVTAVERMILIQGAVPTAHAVWLRRLYEIVGRSARALDQLEDETAMRVAKEVKRASMLPPLAAPADAATTLQIAAVDHLLDASRREREVLAHRRRMLEAARQLLLDISAAIPLPSEGVNARLDTIAEDISWIDRVEATGVNANVELTHQARSAFARKERDRLYAVLSAIDRFAAIDNDTAIVAWSERALDRMRDENLHGDENERRSLVRSAKEVLGERALLAIHRGHQRARELNERGRLVPPRLEDLMRQFLAPGAEHAMLHTALSVDGCFEVGGALSPARITDEYRTRRVVEHPAKELALVHAHGPEDLPHAVIDDPRGLILALASGRLLARRYIDERVETRHRTVMRGEVRIYLLDGSTSMLGPRSRMRDTILVAELATLARRLSVARADTRVVLYYRYFSDQLDKVQKIETAQQAIEHIETVLSTGRQGGTDIELALLNSLQQIREAKETDPTLASAQIVLITDGEAEVSASRVREKRDAIGQLPVGISVIAIGQENAALRAIVAAQRRNGERAFYHFVSDTRLQEIADGKSTGAAIHLPPLPHEAIAASLDQELEDAIEQLARLRRDRARDEPSLGDKSGLSRRLLRWFPDPARLEADRAPPPEEGTVEKADLETIKVLLSTIAEVLRLIDGSAQVRQADAIDLVERMLPDARLSPARWELVMSRWPASLRHPLLAVHDAIKRGAFAAAR